MKKLLCIDGNSILNRSFYGIRLLTNREGFHTNALYGLVNVISKQLEALKPDYAVIAYDLKEPTFRHKMYEAYKAGRHAMPDELREQMPASRPLSEALGLHVLDCPGYEADDILGTLVNMSETCEEPCEAYVLTGDKDSLQLISATSHVLLAGNTETKLMDEAAFMEKYGVRPDQFVDVKALMGDSSDNIPGVPGIGEKTALKLISEFGSLDGIYEALPTAKHTPSVRKKLEEGKDSAYLSQTLARICREAPLGLTLDQLTCRPMDRAALYELCVKYEFSGFIKRFDLHGEGTAVKADETADTPVQDKAVCLVSELKPLTNDTLASLPAGRYALHLSDSGTLTLWDGKIGYISNAPDVTALSKFLSNAAHEVITYDAKGLYKQLSSMGIEYRGCGFDVMLGAYVINAGMGSFDLDRLCIAFLGESPREEVATVGYIFDLYAPLLADLKNTQQDKVFFDIEMPLSAVLCDMELIGFKVEPEAIRKYGLILDTLAADLESRIFTYAGREFNINSPKQLGEILFEVLMLPTDKKTKTGYSTSAEVLEKLKKYHPIIEDILEYRQVTKLKSTYVDGLLKVADGEGRIHTTFKQTGTATGRLSSAEPNLQNIPIRTELGRELRRFFVASAPDRVLIDADYSQIELRLLAAIAGDDAMRSAFLGGFDIHTDTASRVFGVPPEAVTIELRKKAKAVNFGIMYGMGDFSLAEDLHISRAEAKSYIESYLHSYPQIDKYLKDIIQTAYDQGYVTTELGRRRLIPELAESNKMRKKFGERVAMNSPIQGTAADIIKLAMIRVDQALKNEKLKARLILQVHDELIVECPLQEAETVKKILTREMEQVAKLKVPLVVEAKLGGSWYEAK